MGNRSGVVNMNESEERSICTSRVERHNRTIRTFMIRFTQLSLAFSKKLECLEADCHMFIVYCNLVWRTRHTDQSSKAGLLRPTAAMMAGAVDERWKFNRFYDEDGIYG